ncbi:MAG: prepilin-type N-terminal cleavage/methylation domain-containing protein [Planctomycetes bacterium]|nr:prepilin-type N-terminal cleavage/methylation domain-containing protein [Planctomycetota bacterium]
MKTGKKSRARGGTDRAGFTLIEILLALVVLTVGLCGLLALFPVGIRSNKESTEDTMAALVAESVFQSVVRGMRESNGSSVTFKHDGLPSGTYTATLPAGLGGKLWYPTQGSVGTDPSGQVFLLGRAGDAITGSILDITDQSVPPPQVKDPSESYTQYSFDVEFTRVQTGGLFQVVVRVYRNYEPVALGVNQKHPRQVRMFGAHIATP